MIKLTDRLQVLADQIKQNETMADIGTDHGFLPIYLWENEISPKVIMADISPGSLEKARVNCYENYPNEKFDLRLGNGIQILENGEVDAVVIAGIFLLEHLLKRRKKTASPSAESGPKDQRINLLFYDTFLHCTFPSYPGTSYYYKDFYQIKEGPSIFCLYLTRTKLVIVEKKNCSPELIDHIRQLQKLRK